MVSEILGRLRQLFPFKRTVRTQRYREDSSLLSSSSSTGEYQIWIEARSMIRPHGPAFPPLIISDNNIGIVTISESASRIVHELMVRKTTREAQIYRMIASTGNEKNAMVDAVRLKIRELGAES